jgi:hypothetical protein
MSDICKKCLLPASGKVVSKIVRAIQLAVIAVCLTLVYFLGFGITALVMLVFKRALLTGSRKRDASFWVRAEGYDADSEESLRES